MCQLLQHVFQVKQSVICRGSLGSFLTQMIYNCMFALVFFFNGHLVLSSIPLNKSISLGSVFQNAYDTIAFFQKSFQPQIMAYLCKNSWVSLDCGSESCLPQYLLPFYGVEFLSWKMIVQVDHHFPVPLASRSDHDQFSPMKYEQK